MCIPMYVCIYIYIYIYIYISGEKEREREIYVGKIKESIWPPNLVPQKKKMIRKLFVWN